MSTILWPLLFKVACHKYNILEMDEGGKKPEQKFAGVELHISTTDYSNWGCPVFVLESPLQGGTAGLPK